MKAKDGKEKDNDQKAEVEKENDNKVEKEKTESNDTPPEKLPTIKKGRSKRQSFVS